MFARIESTLKPEIADHLTTPLLRRLEMTDPHLRRLVRWARQVDVFWMDVPLSREDLIFACTEVLWDPVLNWLFTGNLIPSAAGIKGGIEDLLETAPHRPGNFFAIEKRLRLGVNDFKARTLLSNFETVLRRKLPEARVCSGALLVVEGVGIGESQLAALAKNYFANELLESWTIMPSAELVHSERFFPERVKREMPKAHASRFSHLHEKFSPTQQSSDEMIQALKKRGIRFRPQEFAKIHQHFSETDARELHEVELEFFAKYFESRRVTRYLSSEFRLDASVTEGTEINRSSSRLLAETFRQSALDNPRSWMLTNFEGDRPAFLGMDDDEALLARFDMESALLKYDAKQATEAVVARSCLRSVCEEKGVRPILLQNWVHLLSPHGAGPETRRALDRIRIALGEASSRLGTPMLGGHLQVELKAGSEFPTHVGITTLGSIPRGMIDLDHEFKKADAGDRILVLGSPGGREGTTGGAQVQKVDTLMLKRLIDFVMELRDRGHSCSFQPCLESGLAGALAELGERYGGFKVNLDQVPTDSTISQKPVEIIASRTLERILVRVPADSVATIEDLAKRRLVPSAVIGEFVGGTAIQAFFQGEEVAHLDISLFRQLESKDIYDATYTPPAQSRAIEYGDVAKEGLEILLKILSHPNLCSREWLIQQMDQEVQGHSLLKPLQQVLVQAEAPQAGPNDGVGFRPKGQGTHAILVSQGHAERAMDVDPYLAGMLAVDEAIRNGLACGADYGKEDSLFGLGYQLVIPEKNGKMDSDISGKLARLAFGAYFASKELELPFVTGAEVAVEGDRQRPELAVTAISKVAKVAGTRSAEFKTPGDPIYLLGPAQFSLRGSVVAEFLQGLPDDVSAMDPDWSTARRLYSWLGGTIGKEQKKLRSLHDVSDGGLLAAVSECSLSRGFGALVQYPEGMSKTMEWEFLFGEGFHGMLVTSSEVDSALLEAEWSQNEIPFCRLGQVLSAGTLQVKRGDSTILAIETKVLRQAWKKEGFWE